MDGRSDGRAKVYDVLDVVIVDGAVHGWPSGPSLRRARREAGIVFIHTPIVRAANHHRN